MNESPLYTLNPKPQTSDAMRKSFSAGKSFAASLGGKNFAASLGGKNFAASLGGAMSGGEQKIVSRAKSSGGVTACDYCGEDVTGRAGRKCACGARVLRF